MGIADFAIAGQQAAQAVQDKAPDAREKVDKFLKWDELKHERFARVVEVVAKVGLTYAFGGATLSLIGGGTTLGGVEGADVSTTEAVDYGLGNASGGPEVSTGEAIDAGLVQDSGGWEIPQWLKDAGRTLGVEGTKLLLRSNGGSGINPNPQAGSALPQENRGSGLSNFIYGGGFDSLGGDASGGSSSGSAGIAQRLMGVALIAVLSFVVLNVAYRFFRR